MKLVLVFIKVLLTFITLTIFSAVANVIVPVKMQSLPNAEAWWLLSNVLVAVAITLVGVQTHWRGLRLALALSAIPFVLQMANLIEGAIFLTKTVVPWGRVMMTVLIGNVLASPCWLLIFRKPPTDDEVVAPNFTTTERLVRFLICDVSYLVLYYSAGLIVYPYVRDFYATQTIPPIGKLVSLQLIIRGPMFIAICLLLSRMLRISGLVSALKVGLIFTTVSGIAALIVPNPLFPDAIRWAHFCEVVSSNFIFGSLVALLWTRSNVGVTHSLPSDANVPQHVT